MQALRFMLAAAFVSALAGEAHADRYRLEFSGSAYGVIPLGRATLDLNVGPESYRAEATIRSGGLAALFDNTHLRAESEGEIAGARLSWRTFALDHRYARKHRVTDMRLTEAGVAAQITPPHRDPEEIRPSAAQKAEARDPLASLTAMAAQVAATGDCAGVFPTFDGRFRYDLELRVEGRDVHAGGGYDGPVLKCKLRYRPIAGYQNPRSFQRRIPEGEIWFALTGGAIAPPVRVTAPMPLGRAGIRLDSFRRVDVQIGDLESAE